MGADDLQISWSDSDLDDGTLPPGFTSTPSNHQALVQLPRPFIKSPTQMMTTPHYAGLIAPPQNQALKAVLSSKAAEVHMYRQNPPYRATFDLP